MDQRLGIRTRWSPVGGEFFFEAAPLPTPTIHYVGTSPMKGRIRFNSIRLSHTVLTEVLMGYDMLAPRAHPGVCTSMTNRSPP